MKVLWLASWYPNKDNFLNGDFIQRQARAVAEMASVTVVSVAMGDATHWQTDESTSGNLTEIILIAPFRGKRSAVLKAYYYVYGYCKILRILKVKRFVPSLVHLNVIYPVSVIALLYKLWFRVPLIISEHSAIFAPNHDGPSRIQHILAKTVNHFSACNVVVSKQLQKAMESNALINHYQIIENVVDTSLFFFSGNPKPLCSQMKMVFIANLDSVHKDFLGLLRILSKYKEQGGQFQLTVIGQTQRLSEISALIREYELTTNITLIKEQEHAVIASTIKAADVLLLNSNYETFGCVIIEALACGVPVISTKTGVAEIIVNESNGYLVNSGNDDEFLAALQNIRSNYGKYNPHEISRAIHDRCSYPTIANQILQIYQKVLRK